MSKVTERRKLLQEMERVFKLIKEGLDEFDTKFKEAKQAPTKQMKEKFTDELAKKLTKLKRFRENVMTWSNHRDVKDKTNELEEMRLDIETRMEAYRAMEKEDKIKPFSERALEMEPKIDPKEKERDETIGWLRTTIYDLNQQCEPWEAELEKLGSAVGATTTTTTTTSTTANTTASAHVQQSLPLLKRNRERPRLGYHQAEKIEILTKRMEQNHNHVAKLELILRALHNDCLTVNDLQRLNLRKRIQKFVDAQQACKTSLLLDDDLDMYDDVLELIDTFDTNLLITSPTSGEVKENDPSTVAAVAAGGNSIAINNEKLLDNSSTGETMSLAGSHYDTESKRKTKHETSAVDKGSSKFFSSIRRRQSAPSSFPNSVAPTPLVHVPPKMLPPENHPTPIISSSVIEPPRPQILQYSTVAASGVARPPTAPQSTVSAPKVEPVEDSDYRALELSSEPSLVDFSQDSLKQNESPTCSLLDHDLLYSDHDLLPWLSMSNSHRSCIDITSLNQHQLAAEANSDKSPIDEILNDFSDDIDGNYCDGFVDSLLALNPLGVAPFNKEHENVMQYIEKSFHQMASDDPATTAANRTMHKGFQVSSGLCYIGPSTSVQL